MAGLCRSNHHPRLPHEFDTVSSNPFHSIASLESIPRENTRAYHDWVTRLILAARTRPPDNHLAETSDNTLAFSVIPRLDIFTTGC